MSDNIKEIRDNIYMITLPMPFRLEEVNVFICVDTDHLTLIDTGPNLPDTFSALEESIKTIGFSVKDINRILITHYHVDHCGMAGQIQKISGASVQMSKICAQTMDTSIFEQRVKLMEKFCLEHGLDNKTITTITRFFRMFKLAHVQVEADKFLQHDEILKIDGMNLKVIQTPGHTRGHIGYLFPEKQIYISGDHILPHITPNLSMDLLKPDFRPLHSFINSLEKLTTLPISEVYPAHGKPFPGLKERVEEIKEHHRERKELILESLKKNPKTTCQVAMDIFGDDIPLFDKHLALHETYVHIIELKNDSLITHSKNNGKYIFSII